MDDASPRAVLDRLIREKGTSYGALSHLIGRNSAYIQQYVKRGTPRKLDEADRARIARFLGVEESLLVGLEDGGTGGVQRASGQNRKSALASLIAVPRLPLGASAGSGTLDEDEVAADSIAFNERWLRDMGGRPDSLSIIRVDGESMIPTLGHGDDIMVDRSDAADRLRDGIYVLRLDDALMVKRVAMTLRRDRFSVRSDNPAYPDWEDVNPESVAIMGRVIWVGRRLA